MKQTFIILLLLRFRETDAFTFARAAAKGCFATTDETAHSPLKRWGDSKQRRHLSIQGASEASSINGDVVSQEQRVLDSEALFEADVTRVIQELRPWPYDPSVPSYFS